MDALSAGRLPKKLREEPLVEAQWAIHFNGDTTAGSVLPGILYDKYRTEFPDIQLFQLPASGVPVTVRSAQPELQNIATHALRFGVYTAFVGDRMVALSSAAPYPGWAEFRRRILGLASWLAASELVDHPLQCTLRYTDFFAGGTELFDKLVLDVSVGGQRPSGAGLHLHMGTVTGSFTGAIEVMFPVRLDKKEAGREDGLLTNVQIAFSVNDGESPWTQHENLLDLAKAECHRAFFSLLRPEMIESLDPEYGG